MNQAQFEQMFRQQQQQPQQRVEVPLAKIDEYIKKCMDKKGLSKGLLFDNLHSQLENGIVSPLEANILPLVLKRLQEK